MHLPLVVIKVNCWNNKSASSSVNDQSKGPSTRIRILFFRGCWILWGCPFIWRGHLSCRDQIWSELFKSDKSADQQGHLGGWTRKISSVKLLSGRQRVFVAAHFAIHSLQFSVIFLACCLAEIDGTRPGSEKAGVQKSLPWVLLKVKSLVCRKSAPRMGRLVLVIMNFWANWWPHSVSWNLRSQKSPQLAWSHSTYTTLQEGTCQSCEPSGAWCESRGLRLRSRPRFLRCYVLRCFGGKLSRLVQWLEILSNWLCFTILAACLSLL